MVAFIVFMWKFSPDSRLRGIMGKRPSPSVWACLSTLDTAVHWHAHTYTIAANTHTYQKKQTNHTLCPVTEEKNRSADTDRKSVV